MPDVVIVPVGGGGLVSGIATAVKARHPEARVIGVEPETLDGAARAALAAGHSVPVTPPSAADALNAPFAGENSVEICRGARRRVGARLGGGAVRGVPLALRADEARVRARAPPLRRPRCSSGKVADRARPDRRRGGLGRQHGFETGRCYSGIHEGRHPSRVRPRDRDVLLREHVPDAVDDSPSSTSRSARTATRSTRASRSSWTRAAGWSASRSASSAPSAPSAAQAARSSHYGTLSEARPSSRA